MASLLGLNISKKTVCHLALTLYPASWGITMAWEIRMISECHRVGSSEANLSSGLSNCQEPLGGEKGKTKKGKSATQAFPGVASHHGLYPEHSLPQRYRSWGGVSIPQQLSSSSSWLLPKMLELGTFSHLLWAAEGH